MYCKRFCSDSRIVGVRRRTTLAGWLVLGQGIGFSLGPFAGGLLYVPSPLFPQCCLFNSSFHSFKIGFNNAIFNGFTSPTWIMAVIWAVFWVVVTFVFEDVPRTPQSIALQPMPAQGSTVSTDEDKADEDEPTRITTSAVAPTDAPQPPPSPVSSPAHKMTWGQWGAAATMCWFAMTCFFILGAWEANIPVFTSSRLRSNPFHFSPFAAGNLIALGGACTIPFLLLNLHVARRVQDRHTLAMGVGTGLAGLIIALAILGADQVNYGSLFICWFLVALGFNVASTVTLSLLSKQLPGEWNGRISLAIQYSNYSGRVTGAVWGGAGVKVGMLSYVGMQVALVGIGSVMFMTLWKHLKAKTG